MSQHPHITLEWRSVLGPRGFAAWVRDLSDRSGVYLIRADPAQFADEILYIGESHTYAAPGAKRAYRGLYRTLTRHFHGHRWSQGITYDPRDVLVAVVVTEPAQAVAYQDLLINLYKPRDNEMVKQIRLEAWGITPEEAAAYEAAAFDSARQWYEDEY